MHAKVEELKGEGVSHCEDVVFLCAQAEDHYNITESLQGKCGKTEVQEEAM